MRLRTSGPRRNARNAATSEVLVNRKNGTMADRRNRRWSAASQAALMGNAESQPSPIEKMDSLTSAIVQSARNTCRVSHVFVKPVLHYVWRVEPSEKVPFYRCWRCLPESHGMFYGIILWLLCTATS